MNATIRKTQNLITLMVSPSNVTQNMECFYWISFLFVVDVLVIHYLTFQKHIELNLYEAMAGMTLDYIYLVSMAWREKHSKVVTIHKKRFSLFYISILWDTPIFEDIYLFNIRTVGIVAFIHFIKVIKSLSDNQLLQ